MSNAVTQVPDAAELRPMLHAEVDRLRDEHLGLAHRALLEIELHQLAGELDDSVDAAISASRLNLESIAAAVAAHRAEHPYK
jgi:hypothetical protein